MDRVVNWGVMGAGGIARRRTIPEGILSAENARLSALYDWKPENARALAVEFSTAAAESEEALLGSGIDAVYIATPPALHKQQVLRCAAAGKHVLCEKPLGLTTHDAIEMVEACKSAGVLLATALMMRYQTQHLVAKQYIEEGSLGVPVFGRAQLSCWYPPLHGAWRQNPDQSGGGALMDMGGHCADLLEMLFGPIEEVFCRVANRVHDYPVEDTAAVNLRFASGALGLIDNSFCVPDASSKNVLELHGSGGAILASGTIGQEPAGRMVFYSANAHDYDASQHRVEQSAGGIEIAPPARNTYRAEIEDFGAAVLASARGPVPDLSGPGLRSQILLAACYESAAAGCSVRV